MFPTYTQISLRILLESSLSAWWKGAILGYPKQRLEYCSGSEYTHESTFINLSRANTCSSEVYEPVIWHSDMCDINKLFTLGYSKFTQWRFWSESSNETLRVSWIYRIRDSYMRKRTVWISVQRRLKSACAFIISMNGKIALVAIQNAPSEDSDQTARMRRLIWIFAGRICPVRMRACPMVRFLTLRVKLTARFHKLTTDDLLLENCKGDKFERILAKFPTVSLPLLKWILEPTNYCLNQSKFMYLPADTLGMTFPNVR